MKNPIDIYNFSSGVEFLSALYSESKSSNPRYSLRSFANKIGLDQSALTRYFGKERLLSSEKAALISEKLKLSPPEAHFLKLLILLGDRGELDLLQKLKASFLYDKMTKMLTTESGKPFLQNLDFIMDLKVVIIYELHNLKNDFTISDMVRVLEKYFKTDDAQVYQIVNSLVNLGFMEESKQARRDLLKKIFYENQTVPREAGVKFHTDALTVGQKALENFATTDMEIFSSVVSIKKEGRQKIYEAYKQLTTLISEFSGEEGDDVYVLTQFMVNITSETDRDQKPPA